PELVARIVAAAAEIREHPDMLLRVHQSEDVSKNRIQFDCIATRTITLFYCTNRKRLKKSNHKKLDFLQLLVSSGLMPISP
ncbi:hypothetical protein L9F63_018067, partial [Diploptera punctata]